MAESREEALDPGGLGIFETQPGPLLPTIATGLVSDLGKIYRCGWKCELVNVLRTSEMAHGATA